MALLIKPVKEQIYDIIKERILSEELMFGEKINILTLSKELGVSNTPIREALSMLERDGLVEVIPNAGPKVISYSEKKFFEIEQSMEALLIGAYETAFDNGKTDELVSLMEQAVQNQKDALNTENRREYARLSMEFDACFVTVNENRFLTDMYNQISNIFTLVVLYEHKLEKDDRQPIIEEHMQLLEAVRAEQHDTVISLLKQHYGRISKVIGS